ncbi:hypothetical protein D9M71_191990 [compost metagenome]
MSGARYFTPNDIGAVMRTRPLGVVAWEEASASAARPSARMRWARSHAASPVGVRASRREVRWSR